MENRQNDNQNKRNDQYKSSAMYFGIGVLGVLGMILYHLITK